MKPVVYQRDPAGVTHSATCITGPLSHFRQMLQQVIGHCTTQWLFLLLACFTFACTSIMQDRFPYGFMVVVQLFLSNSR